ncbi:hypothetical protein V6Z77_007134 [Aspergillus fumigatus]|nr:hypothetical protein KXW37_001883 [Aspergillus fumigatus]
MSRHNEFDRSGSVLATERHHAFLGTAKVQLRHIDIGPKGRLDRARVRRLRRVFRVNGIYPLQRENHVEVVICQSDLEQTLDQNGLTLQEFRAKDPDSYPTLDFTGRPLRCLHGKHRIQAARDVLPSFRRWWIADFYTEGSPYASQVYPQAYKSRPVKRIAKYSIRNIRAREPQD